MEQGVRILDCTNDYKLLGKGNFETQHESRINAEIKKLNSQGKRVISISISQCGNSVPLCVSLLWEKS